MTVGKPALQQPGGAVGGVREAGLTPPGTAEYCNDRPTSSSGPQEQRHICTWTRPAHGLRVAALRGDAVTEPATAAPYEHPPYRCGSIQCARCYNLIDPTKPLYKDREADDE